MTGFQTSIARNLAFGIPGDFATTGPWTTVPAGAGELTAGSAGVTIAAFAWADDTTGVVTNGKPNLASTRFGFVGRNQRSVITAYLAESSFVVNAGMEITLYDGGAYHMVAPSGGATIGQKVFARYADGVGIVGTSGTLPTATRSVTTTDTSTTISYTGGAIYPGQPISGTGIPAGARIASVNSGAGTAVLSAAATASGTVTGTFTTAYETQFWVKTPGAAGEIIIISDKGF